MLRRQVGRAVGRARARDGPGGLSEELGGGERMGCYGERVYLGENLGEPRVLVRCGNWGDERT